MFGLSELATKLIAGGVSFVVIAGSVIGFIAYERSVGAARCEAAVKEATDREQQRETDINGHWQEWANGAIANSDRQKALIDARERQNVLASAANNGRSCMPADAAGRVRSIGKPGGQAGSATGAKPGQR